MNNVLSPDSLFHKRVFRIPDHKGGYTRKNTAQTNRTGASCDTHRGPSASHPRPDSPRIRIRAPAVVGAARTAPAQPTRSAERYSVPFRRRTDTLAPGSATHGRAGPGWLVKVRSLVGRRPGRRDLYASRTDRVDRDRIQEPQTIHWRSKRTGTAMLMATGCQSEVLKNKRSSDNYRSEKLKMT